MVLWPLILGRNGSNMSIQQTKNLNSLKLLFSKPGDFFSKVERKINAFSRDFFIDPATRAFIDHNRKVWQGHTPAGSSKIILFDFHNLPQFNIVHSYFFECPGPEKGRQDHFLRQESIPFFTWRSCGVPFDQCFRASGHAAVRCSK